MGINNILNLKNKKKKRKKKMYPKNKKIKN